MCSSSSLRLSERISGDEVRISHLGREINDVLQKLKSSSFRKKLLN